MKFFNRSCGIFVGIFVATIFSTNLAFAAGEIGLSYSFTPSSINPGQTTSLKITISNNKPSGNITGVGFNLSLPSPTSHTSLKIKNTTTTYTCHDYETDSDIAGVGLTANGGGNSINLSGATIPAKSSLGVSGKCDIIIPVVVSSTDGSVDDYNYIITGGSISGDGASNDGNGSASLHINSFEKPTITKSFSNSGIAVIGGDPQTLTITIKNNNTDLSKELQNFKIADTLPSTIEVATPIETTSTCPVSGAYPSFSTEVSNGISFNAGIAKAGETCTMTVKVKAVGSGDPYETTATNTIHGTTINLTTTTIDFTSDAGIKSTNDPSATIKTRSPLDISTQFDHSPVASGQQDTFRIIFTNKSLLPLTINSFTDNLPSGITISGINSNSCSLGGSVGSYSTTSTNITQTSPATIAANNGTCTLVVNYSGHTADNTTTQYTNNIFASAITTNTNVKPKDVSAQVSVYHSFEVSKSATPSNPAPGNPVKYVVTVKNWSDLDVSPVQITDDLNNGQTFLNGTIGGIDYSPVSACGIASASTSGATSPVIQITTLPGRSNFTPGTCSVTFYAMTKSDVASGSINNTIKTNDVSGGGFHNVNPASSSNLSITNPLAVTKSFSPSGPLSEGVVTRMTITLSNLSANPLTNVSISDSLPIANLGGGQMKFSNTPHASKTCSGGSINVDTNTNTISLTGSSVPARAEKGAGAAGTCKLEVDVVAPAGTYHNVANVSAAQTFANSNTPDSTLLTASPSADITYSSAISVSKSFSPTTVISGGKSTVTIRLTNSGTTAITNLSVTDNLTTGMTLTNSANAYTTCAGGTTFPSGPTSTIMSAATVSGNGTCDVVFDVIATGAPATLTNTINPGDVIADNGIRNQIPESATLTISPTSSVEVEKSFTPSTINSPGQISELKITIKNNNSGSQKLTNLSLTDYFTENGGPVVAITNPVSGIQITPTPESSTNCTGGTITANPNGTFVSISGVSLESGDECFFTTKVTLIKSNTIKNNIIKTNSVLTDQGFTNSSPVSVNITTNNAIGVLKKFTPNTIKPGQRSRLRITMINPTIYPVSGAGVVDDLPNGVTIPSNPNPYVDPLCNGATISTPTTSQIVISGANIVPASGNTPAKCYVEIDVTAGQGDYVNTIPNQTLLADVGGKPTRNPDPTTDTLRAKLPVEIHIAINSKTLDTGSLPSGFSTGTATANVGAIKTLTIALTNPNSEPLTMASFTNSLPTGLFIDQILSTSTNSCGSGVVSAVASGTSIGLTGATIAGGGTCKVTVNVVSNIHGTYLNTIPTNNVSTLEGVTNEEPTSAQITISNPPVVTKQFTPSVIPAGGTSRLTIFFVNDNASDATLTSLFTDTLPTAPGNMVIAATPNVSKTCPGTVTAAVGSGTISYASGELIPVGGCSISVDVTASTIGSYTNNIPAAALKTSFGDNQQPAFATLGVSATGFISGKIFKDNNITPNGIFDFGTDTPISGASVELRSGGSCTAGSLVTNDINSNPIINPTTTDIAGNYLFYGSDGLPAGTYSVCQNSQAVDTINGITTAGPITSNAGSAGAPGNPSNPTPSTSQIVGIFLNNNGTGGAISGSGDNNFAEVVPSTISGRVFLDQNNNGIQNGSDTAITIPQTIELLDDSDALIRTTTTTNGDYSFTGLAPARYSIRQPNQPDNTNSGKTTAGTVGNSGTAGTPTNPTITPSKISNIILPPNTTTSGNNFAEIPNTKTISGSVFLDYDSNGVQNGTDYGLDNITLNLTGIDSNGNSVSVSTTTNGSGVFEFTGLPEGTYRIDQPDQPIGTSNGTTTAGDGGGNVSDPTPTSSRVANIVLNSATLIYGGYNFAEIPNNAVDLTITKTHTPSSFGEGSKTGVFNITVKNIGSNPTSGTISVVDTLPSGLTLAATPTGSGWSCSGVVGAPSFTCTTNNVLSSGDTPNLISAKIKVANSGFFGQALTNNVVVSGGNETAGFQGNNSASDSVTISESVSIRGTVWRDSNHDKKPDGEPKMSGWLVRLLLNGNIVETVTTGSDGKYSIEGVSPASPDGSGNSGYSIQFVNPKNNMIFVGAVTNENDSGANPANADTSKKTLDRLSLVAGVVPSNDFSGYSLPLDPSGVIYDSITRQPISGVRIRITYADGSAIPIANIASPIDPDTNLSTDTMVTDDDGMYEFFLQNDPTNQDYLLTITGYPNGYNNAPSTVLPVCNNVLMVNNTPSTAAIQSSIFAPTLSASTHIPTACPVSTLALSVANQASTQYYRTFTINTANSGEIVNNHIPLDPSTTSNIVVTKTSPLVNVNIGQLVPYSINVKNLAAVPFSNLNLVDTIPAGFKFKSGSATVKNVKTEPQTKGRTLTFSGIDLAAAGAPNAQDTVTIKMLLVVGSGVQVGQYTNQARVFDNTNTFALSNVGTATVNVVPDPLFECSEIIGKVFDDTNGDGYPDQGEKGLANVRVSTVNGMLVTTDPFGRFHIACAAIPDSQRGSNFIMKLDERTLPSGYKITSENPRVVRLTAGKMVKLNFGAALHKTLQLDLKNEAFEKDSINLKNNWLEKLQNLPQKMKEEVYLVKINYLQAVGENLKLAKDRLKNVVQTLRQAMKKNNCCENTQIKDKLIKPQSQTNSKGGK